MNEEEKGVVVKEPIVMPVVTPTEAKEAWDKYLALKEVVKQPTDVQMIQGKEYLKKSYWRKIATFFNLSVECVREERKDNVNIFTLNSEILK